MSKIVVALLCLACFCLGGSIGFLTAATMYMAKHTDEQLERAHRREQDK